MNYNVTHHLTKITKDGNCDWIVRPNTLGEDALSGYNNLTVVCVDYFPNEDLIMATNGKVTHK
jgi:hypothetical protein